MTLLPNRIKSLTAYTGAIIVKSYKVVVWEAIMARRSFEQIRASIMYNESLHKIEDGMNYGVDIEKLCRLLENECKQPGNRTFHQIKR